jgi:uncharacterized damage-inducible protein DinB
MGWRKTQLDSTHDRGDPPVNTIAFIQRMHQHRRWADDLLLETARGLSQEQLHQPIDIGQGSVWATLTHLYGAEWVWIETIQGRQDAPLPSAEAFESLEALSVAWSALHKRWERYLAELRPGALEAKITRSSSMTAGQSLVMPLHDVLIHVCTHAQYTSAQMVHMLKRLGLAANQLPGVSMTVISRGEFNP